MRQVLLREGFGGGMRYEAIEKITLGFCRNRNKTDGRRQAGAILRPISPWR
jgi:hypothetical protein